MIPWLQANRFYQNHNFFLKAYGIEECSRCGIKRIMEKTSREYWYYDLDWDRAENRLQTCDEIVMRKALK